MVSLETLSFNDIFCRARISEDGPIAHKSTEALHYLSACSFSILRTCLHTILVAVTAIWLNSVSSKA